MTCKWCEQNKELINLCDNTEHSVCKICYENYLKLYPLRVEGCPYCKGLEEKVIVYVQQQDNLSIPYEVAACIVCYSLICFSIIIYFLIIVFNIILNNK